MTKINNPSLNDIISPISEDLKSFEIEYERATKSDVSLINTITKYMMRNKGKNIRPSLTLLSARLCGEPTLNTYRAAAMMEYCTLLLSFMKM
jgi:Geranylgeranyl pyrophosphate synthase